MEASRLPVGISHGYVFQIAVALIRIKRMYPEDEEMLVRFILYDKLYFVLYLYAYIIYLESNSNKKSSGKAIQSFTIPI